MLTIKEVADLAGVSKATVSRVINNSGYVSPQTRLKIESIMKQYNYLPSASAVNLSRQETSTVGVVVPEIGNRFYADVVHGITEMADQMNLSLVFFSTSNSPEQEEKAIRTLRQQQVRGIILGPSVDYMRSSIGRSIHSELKALSVPIIVVDRMFENMEWDAVVYENFQSSYRAALELHKAGNGWPSWQEIFHCSLAGNALKVSAAEQKLWALRFGKRIFYKVISVWIVLMSCPSRC